MTKQIPWLRIIMEGGVIVASILLAFGIDAWWDGRQADAEAVEMLLGLQSDFEGHGEVFERHMSMYEEIQADFRILMAADAAKGLRTERLDSAFYRLITVPTLDLGQGTRDAVILSGRLELIENSELRTRLANWGRWVDEIRDMQLTMRDYSWNQIAPYVATRGVPMARAMATRHDWPAAQPNPEDVRQAYESVMNDRTFQSLLAMRYGVSFWHVSAYHDAIGEVDEVVRLVKDEIARRR